MRTHNPDVTRSRAAVLGMGAVPARGQTPRSTRAGSPISLLGADRSREVRDVRCPTGGPFDCRPRHHRQRRSHGTGAHRRDRPACQTTRDNCTGSQSAAWSPPASAFTGISRTPAPENRRGRGRDFIAMSGDGRLLYIQSMTIGNANRRARTALS